MAKAISRAQAIHRQIEIAQDYDEGIYREGCINDEDMTSEASSADQLLLYGYTDEERGIHVRRTLAQSFYPMLPDTKKRDRSQALLRYHKPDRPKCVAIVDELWLYILDGGCRKYLHVQ
jgi:hypothetical protein